MIWQTIRDRLVDELLARRVDRWITGAIAVFLVVFGFLLGRWTSLTIGGTPVVFQEAPAGGNSAQGTGNSGPTDEQLRALVAKPSQEPSTKNSAPQGTFVASSSGAKYYYPDCTEVKRIKEENRVWFDSEQEATESGYEPSVCVQKRGSQ